MENVNIVLAANILKYRKKSGLSQDELAQKLGITFQAVSKWENAKAAPDIIFLPIMADIFGCYIDELFSREVNTEIHYDHCAEFPWPDDNTIRIFQTIGKKIIKRQEANTCIEVAFPRNCNETTRQYFKVEVFGNIVSDSSINGDVVCHGRIDCHEINGDINTQGNISAYQINSQDKIESEVLTAENIAYLTDNCGEIVLDKLLIKQILKLNENIHIDVIVRGQPALNDCTIEDAKQTGLDKLVSVTSNGTAIAGTCLGKISNKAKELIDNADIIISKGQGNFETLHHSGKNIYYLFLCKCKMFAERFGVDTFTGMFINDRNLERI